MRRFVDLVRRFCRVFIVRRRLRIAVDVRGRGIIHRLGREMTSVVFEILLVGNVVILRNFVHI